MQQEKFNFKQIARQYELQTSDKPLPYGIGCAWVRENADKAKLREGIETLQHVYNSGARYFDTSEAYGESELVVGEFVRTIPRHSIFLATKSKLPNLESADAVAHIRNNLERSLRRLHTDYLDLFQLHDIDARYETEGVHHEVIRFLTDAQESGLIRCFGMALRSHRILEQAIKQGAYSSILTYGDYTPVNQSAEQLIRMAADAQVGVVNGSPLGNRWLNGMDPRARDGGHDSDQMEIQREAIAFYDFCKVREVSVLAAALQFPLQNTAIDMTLTGPANIEQWTQSLEALQVPLPPSFWMEWKLEWKPSGG